MSDTTKILALLDDPRTHAVLPSLLKSRGHELSGDGTIAFLTAVIEHGLGKTKTEELMAALRWEALVRAGLVMLRVDQSSPPPSVIGVLVDHAVELEKERRALAVAIRRRVGDQD